MLLFTFNTNFWRTTCRIADIYVVVKAFTTICGSSELSGSVTVTVGSTELISSPPADKMNVQDFTNATNTTEDLLHLIAKRMTLVSLVYEFLVAYLIILTVVFLFICCLGINVICSAKFNTDVSDVSCKCLKKSSPLLRSLMFIDSIAIIILAPFGNVYMFVLGCGEAYATIGVRIGFYLSTISLPAVDSYLRNNEAPQTNELKSFILILFNLALKLLTCSSCLATFINIAYPEEPIFRYTYLVFTILIGLSALFTYYETLLKVLELIFNCVTRCVPLHEWTNHITFWPSMVANLGLLGMNAFILYKYIDTEGFNSSGLSLVLNALSFSFTVPVYVLVGVFCGHGPLFKVCCKCYDDTAVSYTHLTLPTNREV